MIPGRGAALAAVLGVLTLVTAGCTSARDLISVREVGGSVVFAICEQMAFDRVSVVSTEKTASPSDFVELWTAGGKGVTGGYLEIEYGVDPEGFETEVGPASVELHGHYIQIHLSQLDGQGEITEDIYAQFDRDTMTDDWLNSAGVSGSAPCK